ncbi:MAG TPA: VOC family protein [Steroidobacteraceae bacterium]|nr:VOC family protein [Steroidobacteraceae bacterium]
MIGYVCIGTNDPARSAQFYDPVLAVLGARRDGETERYISWGTPNGHSSLLLIKPLDGKPASVGNGTMVSFAADSKATVDAIHKKAIELGGKDEGPPGARSETFYAAFFRDPDGNKLAAYYSPP